MAPDNDTKSILAQAEAEVLQEQMAADKEKFKAQLRKVAAARAVLANEERSLEVLRRSIEG